MHTYRDESLCGRCPREGCGRKQGIVRRRYYLIAVALQQPENENEEVSLVI